MNDVRLITDGGTRLSNPGDMYVAYRFIVYSGGAGNTTKIQTAPTIVDLHRHGTNNQAEYLAVIYGTNALIQYLMDSNENPGDYSIHLMSDSENLVNQVSGRFKINVEHLRELQKQILNITKLFRTRYFRWVPRKRILIELGC